MFRFECTKNVATVVQLSVSSYLLAYTVPPLDFCFFQLSFQEIRRSGQTEVMERQRDRRTDTKTDRYTDIDRQTDRPRDINSVIRLRA